MTFIFQKISNPKVTHYTIFGERHSGTKLLEKIVKNNLDLLSNTKYGWKHGFGFVDPKILMEDKDTLFLCTIRNPYDWILSFFKEPHHVPQSNRGSLNKFLNNEWYSLYDPTFGPEEILEDRNFVTKKRYKNIFDLRKHKTYYLRQSFPILSNNMILISYEELTSNTNNLINNIKLLLNKNNNTPNNFYVRPYKKYSCDSKTKSIIDKNICWEIEHTVGYYQKDSL